MTVAEARIGLSVIGMLVAVVGVALGHRGVVWVAIGILAVSVLMRIVARRFPTRP